jgi:hypothetical protein
MQQAGPDGTDLMKQWRSEVEEMSKMYETLEVGDETEHQGFDHQFLEGIQKDLLIDVSFFFSLHFP